METPAPAAPPRLLVLDGDEEMRSLVVEVLQEGTFAVVGVSAIDAALRAAHALDFSLALAALPAGASEDDWASLAALRDAASPAKLGLITPWNVTYEEVRARGFASLLRKPVTVEELLTFAAAHTASEPIDSARSRAIFAYFDALSRGDWAGLGRLCAADVVYHLPGIDPRFSRSIQGRRAFCEFSEATFRAFADTSFAVEGLLALPDAVVARYRGQWRGASGALEELPGAVVFRFSGSLIAQIGVRLELADLLAKVQREER